MFGLYDVFCIGQDDFMHVIQVYAMSAIDAMNIATIKGYYPKDALPSLD